MPSSSTPPSTWCWADPGTPVTMVSAIFHFEGRPPRVNKDRRNHWRKEAITRDYRDWAAIQGLGRPTMRPPVEVHVQPITATNVRPDAGACYEVVKAIVDGLIVDSRLLGTGVDDGPDHVKCLHLHAPEVGEDDRLVVEVVEVVVGPPRAAP